MVSDKSIAAIAGLGNPGSQYERTRHNAGFRVLDLLVPAMGAGMQQRKFRAVWGMGSHGGAKILLFKPTTYMNRSGDAAVELLNYFGIRPSQMLVIHDDLDLPVGRIRIARGGGSGGHRGVSSLMECLGTRDFPRLRLGIGRPLHGEVVESFVLQGPYPDQVPLFEGMIDRAAEAVRAILDDGLSAAMNEFNKKES